MNQTAILLILDPRSFALANSAAKALAAALKAKTEVDLADSQRQPMGTLLGTLPILQPIPVATTEGHGFLMALRAIFDTSEDFNWLSSPSYWLAALHGTTFGVLQPCVSVGVNTEPGVGPQFAMPLLLLPPQFTSLPQVEVDALKSFASDMSDTLWGTEPINFTTGQLRLASDGRYLTAAEISQADLATGKLVLDSTGLAVSSGVAISRFAISKATGAGKYSAFAAADSGSESYCTDDLTFAGSSGGDWSGATGGTGSWGTGGTGGGGSGGGPC